MPDSALFGHPPVTEHDYDTVKAIGRVLGVYPGPMDPSKGFPQLAAPAGSPDPYIGGPNFAANIAVLVLVVLVTTTRLMLRAFRHELKLGWDDWAIIPAVLAFACWSTTQLILYTKGRVGHHMWTNTYEQVYVFNTASAYNTLLYFVTTALVKISIALFNRRLTSINSRRWDIASRIFLGVLVLYLLAIIFSQVFLCTPVPAKFDLYKLAALDPAVPFKCGNLYQGALALSVVHLLTDAALLTVPLVILIRLKSMSRPRKFRLAVLFSIGSLSMVGGILRMAHILNLPNDPDRTWIMNGYNTWALIDLTFGIIAASLPVFNAFIFPNRWSQSRRLPHLSRFRARRSDGVSRRLPSPESPPWRSRPGCHPVRHPDPASFLPPKGELYAGKGPDDMSLEFHDDQILGLRGAGAESTTELEKGTSTWNQSAETVGISLPAKSSAGSSDSRDSTTA